jgi:hypothetical protein
MEPTRTSSPSALISMRYSASLLMIPTLVSPSDGVAAHLEQRPNVRIGRCERDRCATGQDDREPSVR